MIKIYSKAYKDYQEIFDIALDGIYSQGSLSWDDDLCNCAYRGKDKGGNTIKCAIGHLIADEDYIPQFEHEPFNSLFKLADFNHDDFTFLTELQEVHDNVAIKEVLPHERMEMFLWDMFEFAEKWGLDYDEKKYITPKKST